MTLAWLLVAEETDATRSTLETMEVAQALVPPLWRTEVANALRSAIRQGRISHEQTLAGLSMLDRFDIQIADVELGQNPPLDILHFALKHDVSAYDAGYLYMAINMRLPLATLDKNLRRAAASAKIELL
jgi:predicted nucleic acid-binding protein